MAMALRSLRMERKEAGRRKDAELKKADRKEGSEDEGGYSIC
jgi:hypothetical protein